MMDQSDLNDIIRQFGANYPTWVKNGIGKDFANIMKTLSSMDHVVGSDLLKAVDTSASDKKLRSEIEGAEEVSDKKKKTDIIANKLEEKTLKDKEERSKDVKKRVADKKNLSRSAGRVTNNVARTLSNLDKRDFELGDILDNVGDATMMVSRRLMSGGAFTVTLGLLAAAFGTLAYGFAKTLGTIKVVGTAYSDMVAAGISFNNGILGYMEATTRSGLSFEDFGEVVNNNSSLFNYLGREGVSNFAAQGRDLLGTGKNVVKFGMSLDAVNDFLALQVELDRYSIIKREKLETLRTSKFDEQLGIFNDYSYILGKSREQIIKEAIDLRKTPTNYLTAALLKKNKPEAVKNLEGSLQTLSGLFTEDSESIKILNEIMNAKILGNKGAAAMSNETLKFRATLSTFFPQILRAIDNIAMAGDDRAKRTSAEEELISTLMNVNKDPSFVTLVNLANSGNNDPTIMAVAEFVGRSANTLSSFTGMNAEQIRTELETRRAQTNNDLELLGQMNNIQNLYADLNMIMSKIYYKVITSKTYEVFLNKAGLAMDYLQREIPAFFAKKTRGLANGVPDNRSDYDVLMDTIYDDTKSFFDSIAKVNGAVEIKRAADGLNCLAPFVRLGQNIHETFGPEGVLIAAFSAPVIAMAVTKGLYKIVKKVVGFLGRKAIGGALSALGSCRISKARTAKIANKRISRFARATKSMSGAINNFSNAASSIGKVISRVSGRLATSIVTGITLLSSQLTDSIKNVSGYIFDVAKNLRQLTVRLVQSVSRSISRSINGPTTRARVRTGASPIKNPAAGQGMFNRTAKRFGRGGGAMELDQVGLIISESWIPRWNQMKKIDELRDSYDFKHLSSSEKATFDKTYSDLMYKIQTDTDGTNVNANLAALEELIFSNGRTKGWSQRPTKIKKSMMDWISSLPWFANGGVVTGDTLARIGEGTSPEVVMPLDPALNDLAEKIGFSMTKFYGNKKKSILEDFSFNLFRKNEYSLTNIMTDSYNEFFQQKDEAKSSMGNFVQNKMIEDAKYKVMSMMRGTANGSIGATTNTSTTGGGQSSHSDHSTGGVSPSVRHTGSVDSNNYSPLPKDTPWLKYSNQGATRNKPIDKKLEDAMSFLADMGVVMEVTSGGQDGIETGSHRRVGSTRHDHGNAADVKFHYNGRMLSWEKPEDIPILMDIISVARGRGITGVGAARAYMGQYTTHIGFGTTAVWGGKGNAPYAPLKEAFHNPKEFKKNPYKAGVKESRSKDDLLSKSSVKETSSPANETVLDSMKKMPRKKPEAQTSGTSTDKTKKEVKVSSILGNVNGNLDEVNRNFETLNSKTKSAFGIIA